MISNSEVYAGCRKPAGWIRNAIPFALLDGCSEMDRLQAVEGPAWFPCDPPASVYPLVGLYRKAAADE